MTSVCSFHFRGKRFARCCSKDTPNSRPPRPQHELFDSFFSRLGRLEDAIVKCVSGGLEKRCFSSAPHIGLLIMLPRQTKTKQRTLNGKRRIQRSILGASNIQNLRKIHRSRFETHDIAISESPIVAEAVFR
jgi:hypothetical protein